MSKSHLKEKWIAQCATDEEGRQSQDGRKEVQSDGQGHRLWARKPGSKS